MNSEKGNIVSLVHAWTKGRFVMKSSYYTGRGPNEGDLNSEILEDFYKGLKKEKGKELAKNFVNFVAHISDLSASSFIQSFEIFWKSGCVNTDVDQGSASGYVPTSRDETQFFIETQMVISAIRSGNILGRDEIARKSWFIKSQFLLNHEKEIRDKKKMEYPRKIVAFAIFVLFFLAGCLQDVGPRRAYSEVLTEEATVVDLVYTPSSHGTAVGPTIDWDLNIGLAVTSVNVEEKYAVVFECQHGKFIVQNNQKQTKQLWERLKEGQKVIVSYREVYDITYKDGKPISQKLIKYDFLDAQ